MTNSGKILVIDTSSAGCAAALRIEKTNLVRQTLEPRKAAQSLLPMVKGLLEESGQPLSSLDAIAVAAGPGSFTGLRIGIGVVQGLATAADLPVVSLSNLAVSSFSALKRSSAEASVSCITARDNEVYFGAYKADQQLGVCMLGQEQVAPTSKLRLAPNQKTGAKTWVGIGDALADSASLEQALKIEFKDIWLETELDIPDFCELAEIRLQAGAVVPAKDVQPNYIKEHLDYLNER